MSIHKKGMIVYLQISTWTARKYDRKISREIEDQYHANEAGRYNKILIAKQSLSNIQKIVSNARNFHYENTLPWFDNGGRLLPAANYFDYIARIKEFKDKFEYEVNRFISMYSDYKVEARNRLNGMFRDDDYPNVETLLKKYALSTQINPIPDADDFRVTLNQSEVNNIKTAIEEQVRKSTDQAMTDLWLRLYKVVEHMVERLSKTEHKFKNSLVTNITELCELLPKLNITDDINLNIALNEIKIKLTEFSPTTLREDVAIRSSTAKEAENILNKMKHYLPVA